MLYITPEKLAVAVEDDGLDPTKTDLLVLSCEAATEWVNGHCHRMFSLDEVASARTYRARSKFMVWTGDFPSGVSVTVATDDANDGVWVPWGAGDWFPEPQNPLNGFPFNRISARSTKEFPTNGTAPLVKVTTTWGFAAVPARVTMASRIIAIANYRSRYFTGATAGFEEQDSLGEGTVAFAKLLLERCILDEARQREVPAA